MGLGLGFLLLAARVLADPTVEAYVWQHQSGAEELASLQRFAPQLQGFCVLAAEVTWPASGMKVTRIAQNTSALASVGRPIGLAIRIAAYPRVPTGDDRDANALAELAAHLVAKARAQGLEPAELQVDFDCPEAKLAGYRGWLETLRAALRGCRLVFTALPAWLKHGEFSGLARAADGFVLQVHSLEKPVSFAQDFVLCDPARALEWVHQADKIGVPFRVALPTHGYLLGFDGAGTYLGLAAEGPRPHWPDGTRTRVVRADPAAMVQLARSLATMPLAHCTGLLWFRLPVSGDRLAWDAETFAAVLRGEVPTSHLTVEAQWSEPGLAEISLVNAGETTESLPDFVTLHWPRSEKCSPAMVSVVFGWKCAGTEFKESRVQPRCRRT